MRILLFSMLLFSLVSMTGCETAAVISNNLKGKALNRHSGVFGMKMKTSLDAESGSPSPEVKMGDIINTHQSYPVLPGQSAIINDSDFSFWTGNVTHSQTMIIGGVNNDLRQLYQENPEILKNLSIISVTNGKVKVNKTNKPKIREPPKLNNR